MLCRNVPAHADEAGVGDLEELRPVGALKLPEDVARVDLLVTPGVICGHRVLRPQAADLVEQHLQAGRGRTEQLRDGHTLVSNGLEFMRRVLLVPLVDDTFATARGSTPKV